MEILINGIVTHLISSYTSMPVAATTLKKNDVLVSTTSSLYPVITENFHVGRVGGACEKFKCVHGGFGYGSRKVEGNEILRTCAAARTLRFLQALMLN